MALEGKIVNRNGVLYVLCRSNNYTEPTATAHFFKVTGTEARPSGFCRPDEGDLVTATREAPGANEAWWIARCADECVTTGRVFTEKNAAHVETVAVPQPPARGKELRWNCGRWEKLLKKGWVPA